jgi:hypothetical protein
VLSWGQNDVAGIVTGSPTQGQFVAFAFDRAVGEIAGTNESSLTAFDSGGGLFINSGGIWKLAAINFGVDGKFKINAGDTPFGATLFDKGGLYEQTGTSTFTFSDDTLLDQPGFSYSTRISSNLDFINGVIPEPSSAALVGGAFALIAMRRRRG